MMNPFFHIQHMGHYKLLNLETSIFGPGLFCIRMIGLVFFLSPRSKSKGGGGLMICTPAASCTVGICCIESCRFSCLKIFNCDWKKWLDIWLSVNNIHIFFLLQSKRALLRKYFAAALSSFDELYNIYSALLDIHCTLLDRIAERIWTRRVDSYQAISRYDCCSPRRRWPPMDPAPQWGHSKNQFCILRKRSLCAKIVYEWSKNPNVDDRFQAQTTCLLFLYVTSSNNISKNYYCIICLILEVSTASPWATLPQATRSLILHGF